MASEAKNQDDNLTKGEAIALESLIEVAAGAVVSRTLVKRKGGTVTLFAFDQGQGLSEHTAPFDALVQVLAGRVKLTIGGRDVEAKAGDVVVMPADVPHALDALEPLRMLLVMIRQPE